MANPIYSPSVSSNEMEEEIKKEKINNALRKFNLMAWTNNPNALNVSDPYLLAGLNERTKDTFSNWLLDNMFQKAGVAGALVKNPYIAIPSALAGTAETFFNSRRDKYYETYLNLSEKLGRQPTQEEFNEVFTKTPDSKEWIDAGIDMLAALGGYGAGKTFKYAKRGSWRPGRGRIEIDTGIPKRVVTIPAAEGIGDFTQAIIDSPKFQEEIMGR